MSKLTNLTRMAAVVAVLAVVAGLVIVALPDGDRRHLTAYFPRAVSLYEGSDVRILGVPVGKVSSVRPAGTDVKVTLWYDAKYDVPRDAKAVIVSPAVVGDRFVQLTPVWHRGDRALADHAVLQTSRTGTPLELDEIYQSIDDLTVALGPGGANREGSLTRLLDSTAANFDGQGAKFHRTIRDVGRLTSTLDDNKEELFGTAREIERFVDALATNDRTVRRFNDSLASAADLLAGEREDLRAALRNLGVALEAVQGFVKENRQALSRNIKGLNRVSKVLVKQRAALDEVLTVAPTTLTNLFHTYNPATGTLDTRTNLGENINDLTSDPGRIICGIVEQSSPESKKACDALRKVLPRSGALARTATRSATTRQVERVDRSLGGLLEVRP